MTTLHPFTRYCSCGARFRSILNAEALARINSDWQQAHAGDGHRPVEPEEWERINRIRNQERNRK